MIARMELYLQGKYIMYEDVELSDGQGYDWEADAKIRIIELEAAIEKFKINHLRALLKCNYDYLIVPVIQSKMNHYEPDFDGTEESDRLVDGQNLQRK